MRTRKESTISSSNSTKPSSLNTIVTNTNTTTTATNNNNTTEPILFVTKSYSHNRLMRNNFTRQPMGHSDVAETASSSSGDHNGNPDRSIKIALPTRNEEADEHHSEENRVAWSSKWDFMMSCIGYAVGLGNIWRFPYLCYKNGGGAFLIPYFVCLIFAGIPVFLLETTLGQLLGRGMLSIWKVCPVLKGVGYSSLILLFWMNAYYIVVIGWSLNYFFNSLQFEVPWSHCDHGWNSYQCRSDNDLQLLCNDYYLHKNGSYENPIWPTKIDENITISHVGSLIQDEFYRLNMTMVELDIQTMDYCTDEMGLNFTDPIREYWERHVLRTSSGIENTGPINLEMILYLGLAWLICYWAMYKGIQMSGKIIYVTALFPYFCLTILFVRGITLDGAGDGLKYYFKPNLDRITDPNVWNDAASQIFYSYGLGVGAWIALSSYNKFDNNVFQDTIIIGVINGCTAVFSGMIVFCIVGFMAKQQNKPIESVAASGSGLTFIAYPSATLKMPFVQLWSALFFAMMIMLGFGSLFVQLESFFTGWIDEFPNKLRKHRAIFIGYICVISAIIGLIFLSEAGIYWFELFNYYAASGFALLYLIFFEMIAIIWIYGADNYVSKIEFMLQMKMNIFWKFCWKFVSPVICLAIFIFSLIQYKAPDYNGYQFPTWAIGFGWFLALSSMLAVPIYLIIKVIATPGTWQEKWNKIFTPQYNEIDQMIAERAATIPFFAEKMKDNSNTM